jgi:hypothetical protein
MFKTFLAGPQITTEVAPSALKWLNTPHRPYIHPPLISENASFSQCNRHCFKLTIDTEHQHA